MTFDATVNPVIYEGGIPVFIDIEKDKNYWKYILFKNEQKWHDIFLVFIGDLSEEFLSEFL